MSKDTPIQFKAQVIISLIAIALSGVAIALSWWGYNLSVSNYNLSVSQLSRDQPVYNSTVQFPVGRMQPLSYSPIGNFRDVTVNFALTFSPVPANSSSFSVSSDVWMGNLFEGNISSWVVTGSSSGGSVISYLGAAKNVPVQADIIFVNFYSIKCSGSSCPSSAHLRVWFFLKHV